MRKTGLLILVFAMVTSLSCQDYDISEVVEDSYLFSRDSIDAEPSLRNTRLFCELEISDSLTESASANRGSPMHAPGQRNTSTAWFFNQPWAATFIWGKMVRDSLLLLGLAFVVVFITRPKKGGGSS